MGLPTAAESSTTCPYKVSLRRAYHPNPVPVLLAESRLRFGSVMRRRFGGICPCKVSVARVVVLICACVPRKPGLSADADSEEPVNRQQRPGHAESECHGGG